MILGDSPAIVQFRDSIVALLDRVAGLPRPPPVLLLGEYGTGKALVAKAMHRAGPRKGRPFIRAAITIPELLEVELFGHARHVAMIPQERPGLCQLANEGTLLIDEVFTLLSGDGLRKIVSAIETGSVRRLGAIEKEPADFWLIAASSATLDIRGERRSLRDVFEPLGAMALTVPALRDRGEDVVLLAEHFLARHCRRWNVPPKTFSAEARTALLRYPWPGNVHELSDVIEHAVLSVEGPAIGDQNLGFVQ